METPLVLEVLRVFRIQDTMFQLYLKYKIHLN